LPSVDLSLRLHLYLYLCRCEAYAVGSGGRIGGILGLGTKSGKYVGRHMSSERHGSRGFDPRFLERV
jgi:hypothetical protein